MPIRTREALLEHLIQTGLDEGFATRHAKELLAVAHTSEECALPGYWQHREDYPDTSPSGHVDMGCGIRHRDLAQFAMTAGMLNPLVIYSFLEKVINSTSPHIKVALLPDDQSFEDSKRKGSVGDVMVHIGPYGPRAGEVEQHLNKILADGEPAFELGKCLGFLRAAIGLDTKRNPGSPVLYVDTIQTEANLKVEVWFDDETQKPLLEHSLPGGLRKVYVDGKRNGTAPWHVEALTAVEEACSAAGIPLAVAAWSEVVRRAISPKTLARTESARRLYKAPMERGYSRVKMSLSFPHHYSGPRKWSGYVWLKR